MGKGFPSRRLRGPLPVQAGKFPLKAPRCSTCLSSLDLRPSSLRHYPRCISDRCQPTAGFVFQASLAAFTHAHESSPPPTARLASAPASSEWQTSRCPDLPWPRHQCRMQGLFLPAFPRGLAQSPSPATRGHGFGGEPVLQPFDDGGASKMARTSS